jgi:hypothetical protein
MATRKPLVMINGTLTEIPVGDVIDPSYYTAGTGGGTDMATFDTTLNFGINQTTASASVLDATMTATKVIQAFFTDNLEEVAVLGMRVTERSRTAGVGFDVIGVAPDGAHGIYPVRIITQGT